MTTREHEAGRHPVTRSPVKRSHETHFRRTAMALVAVTQIRHGLLIRFLKLALLIFLALFACYVMSLDPNEPY